jgi:hypothetical protein
MLYVYYHLFLFKTTQLPHNHSSRLFLGTVVKVAAPAASASNTYSAEFKSASVTACSHHYDFT